MTDERTGEHLSGPDAVSLKRKYNRNNLHVYRLAIERVNELAMCFDQIVCTGVLHHLADPDAGLRALREVLVPDGAMHLMVYAPYRRTGSYVLQEFSRRVGIDAEGWARSLWIWLGET
jgi:2-polyprenyl-3-methyl-5-hydroxy-6-metoxy-1,4-benzoquinol methylase